MCGLVYDLSALARDEEPAAPKTAFEKIEEGLKEALEIARGSAQPAEQRKFTLKPGPLHTSPPPRLAPKIAEALRSVARGSAQPAVGERPYLPIHRAMSRMLHADERYENRAFLPGGLLVKE